MKTQRLKILALLCLLITLFWQGASAADYYVSALAGSDANSGSSESAPFKTISKAAGLTNPGDVVLIMNGVYNANGATLLNITRSGTSANYITYKAFTGHYPKIKASGNVWNTIVVNASYIVIEGLELEGDNANLTYEGAFVTYQNAVNGGSPSGVYNTNGISVGGPAAESKFPHHITVRNCKVHDFSGGGLSSIQADYTTFEGNTVYNNAWYMMYAGSGISILTPFDSDTNTGYKNIVRNNIVYNNKTTIPWISITPKRLSDGNGIIIDVNKHTYNNPSGPAYVGRTLVENNVSYNNGGSGIHAFEANHIDIINNTAYNNGVVMGYADIFAGGSSDVKILNNIAYARHGGKCNTNGGNTNVAYDYNIYYNGTTDVQGPNDIVADPKFINASINPAVANFNLQSSSPAINGGSLTAGAYSSKDINGVVRPVGARPEVGAYEYPTGAAAQTITFNALPALSLGAADFAPGATSSSGLPVTYRSSNKAVAIIVNNKIQLINGGTCTITASQGGDETFGAAPNVTQTLTVTGGSVTNLVVNPTFDLNTTMWGNFQSAPASFTYVSAPQPGYSSNVCKITINSLTANKQPFELQISQAVPIIAGKTYSIKFKASASAPRTIDFALQQGVAPRANWRYIGGIALTTTPTTYSYTFTATATDNSNGMKFMVGGNLATVYLDDVEISVIPNTEINIKQATTNIVDDSGTFSFGSVDATTSKTVAFTIENLGDRTLNLISETKVIVSGKGFSLDTDAPAAISAGGTATFSVKFSPDLNGNYSGAISIPNNDLNENPYNFTITGGGVNGAKVDQVITFNPLSNRSIASADFNPGAISNSGLPITYTSSNTAVATIVNGLVHMVGVTGTTVITASQPGDSNFNPAVSVSQPLIVDANLITNSSFDTNTSGWGIFKSAPSDIVLTTVQKEGYNGSVCKALITNGGVTNWFLQMNYPVAIAKDKTYSIRFKANADAPAPIELAFQKGGTTFYSSGAINITTTPTVFGPYFFNSNVTDAASLKLFLGASTGNVYVDDVEVFIVPAPEMNVKQAETEIPDNTGSVSFGDVAFASVKTLDFTVQNLGEKPLTLSGSPKVRVSGRGFSLIADAPASIDSAGNAVFKVALTPDSVGVFNGTISISNNDRSENPYNFAITGRGIKADQIITFGPMADVIYGDSISLAATSSSNLPVTYTVISGPGVITNGNILSYTATGVITLESSQQGNKNFNAAAPVQQSVNIIKTEQLITFNAIADVTYGDSISLAASSSSNLPVSFTVISGPGLISNGNLAYTAAGVIVIEASQAGNSRFNAAIPVQQSVTVNKKQLLVAADNKTVTYRDASPEYTYTITGFVFEQSAADISGSPVLSSTYVSGTPATESPVISASIGSLSSANYSFLTQNGIVTIKHTFPLNLEAEKATINGGSVVSTFSGFTGTGYVDHINKTFDYVEWTADASGTGMCTLKFRYALNNPTQNLKLWINGTLLNETVQFTKIGSWENWGVVSVPVYLNAGLNTIRIGGSGQAGPSFDNLVIENTNAGTIMANNTSIKSFNTLQLHQISSEDVKEVSIYPVPASSFLKVNVSANLKENITLTLADMQGRVLASKGFTATESGVNTVELDIQSFSTGNYILKVSTLGITQSKLILINR